MITLLIFAIVLFSTLAILCWSYPKIIILLIPFHFFFKADPSFSIDINFPLNEIAVLHFAHRTDRWKSLTNHIKVLNGSELQQSLTFEPISADQPSKSIWLSHREIVCKHQSQDVFLVLEDDVRFRSFPEGLRDRALLAFEEDGLDMISLGGYVFLWGEKLSENLYTGFHLGAEAIVWSKKGMKKFCNLEYIEDKHVDGQFLRNLHTAVYYPLLSFQAASKSDNLWELPGQTLADWVSPKVIQILLQLYATTMSVATPSFKNSSEALYWYLEH